jgi:prolyl-tRNA editing enzyme YbaK/EbsC (Cys-tRNA(Pro) deacylase)
VRTAVDVHNYLVARDVPHEMVATSGRVREPGRWAAVLGLDPEEVGRVALFEGQDGELIAALVRADRTPDAGRVAEATGADRVRPIPEDEAVDRTEFLHEALPPVDLPEGTRVVVDEALAGREVLFVPGGEATSMLKIRPGDLLRAAEASVAPLA